MSGHDLSSVHYPGQRSLKDNEKYNQHFFAVCVCLWVTSQPAWPMTGMS